MAGALKVSKKSLLFLMVPRMLVNELTGTN